MLAVDLFDVFELFALFPPTWVYLKRIGSHAYGKYVCMMSIWVVHESISIVSFKEFPISQMEAKAPVII